jgi:hypothetical protein
VPRSTRSVRRAAEMESREEMLFFSYAGEGSKELTKESNNFGSHGGSGTCGPLGMGNETSFWRY